MTRQHDPCVMCSKFSIVGRSQEAAEGCGYCADREEVKAWDGQPCVLFVRARDEAPLRAFAAKHAAQAETTGAASA